MEISLVFPVHASEEVLEEYAFGRLSGDHLDAVDDHLLVCEECQRELARAEEYIRLVRVASLRPRRSRLKVMGDLRSSVRAAIPARTGPKAAVWAGALALACVVGSLSLSNRFQTGAATVALESYRGGESLSAEEPAMNRAAALRPLEFTIHVEDIPAAPAYSMEVVTGTGRKVWMGPAQVSGRQVKAHLDRGLAAGLYWVRLYGQGSGLLSEFGLRVE